MEKQKEFKGVFTTFDMNKEEKYGYILLLSSLAFAVSFFQFFNQEFLKFIPEGFRGWIFLIIGGWIIYLTIFKRHFIRKI